MFQGKCCERLHAGSLTCTAFGSIAKEPAKFPQLLIRTCTTTISHSASHRRGRWRCHGPARKKTRKPLSHVNNNGPSHTIDSVTATSLTGKLGFPCTSTKDAAQECKGSKRVLVSDFSCKNNKATDKYMTLYRCMKPRNIAPFACIFLPPSQSVNDVTGFCAFPTGQSHSGVSNTIVAKYAIWSCWCYVTDPKQWFYVPTISFSIPYIDYGARKHISLLRIFVPIARPFGMWNRLASAWLC